MKFEPRLPAEGINVSPEHPLRELGLLLAGLVGAVVALLVVVGVSLDHLVPLLPAGLETRLFGGDWLAPALASEPADPRTPSVQALLDRLAGHWPDHPYRFRAGVLEEAQPNAMAFPGGWILVTRGLLDQVESENELAFVLGHELGHYRGRDHLRGLGRGLTATLLLAALGSAGPDFASSLAGSASRLAERGFDRDQERAADAFGLSLVHAEYGHVAGALEFFRRLPEPERSLGSRFASYLATHPHADERLAELRAEAQARGWSLAGACTPLAR